MTRASPFRTPAVVLALLAFVAVMASPAAAGNTFRESDANAFPQLAKSALALHSDINNAVTILRQSRELDQVYCLFELENALDSTEGVLSSAYDLVRLSALMRDSLDEAFVNVTLASNASIAMKQLALDRRHALAQGALCSASALVNTYAQKTAAITDRATALFSDINHRLGQLLQHQP